MRLASPAVTAGLNINAQRFVDSRRFVEALGRAVVNRGATMRRLEIRDVSNLGSGVTMYSSQGIDRRGRGDRYRRPVVGPGGPLAARAGAGGHGYSSNVPVDHPIPTPIYLPDVRVACTPHKGAMRLSGTIKFRHPHRAVIPEGVEAVVASASPLLAGVRWGERSNVWVGAHAVTPDGRALISEVSRGVYMAGGHGMWGLAHGPVTGRLLAEQITTGKQP